MMWGRCYLMVPLLAGFLGDISCTPKQEQPISSEATDICTGTTGTFDCVLERFDRFYRSEYEEFWDAYYAQLERVKHCSDARDTTKFLRLAELAGGNAEVSEGFSEDLEEFILAQPDCFLAGFVKTSPNVRNALIRRYLLTPLFHDPAEIRSALAPYRDHPEYGPALEPYFDAIDRSAATNPATRPAATP